MEFIELRINRQIKSILFYLFLFFKSKVGQAKSDSEESTAQVEKALSEVKAIMDELNSLRDINLDDLDALGKYHIVVNRFAIRTRDNTHIFPYSFIYSYREPFNCC